MSGFAKQPSAFVGNGLQDNQGEFNRNMSTKRILGLIIFAGLAALSPVEAESAHAQFHLTVGAYIGNTFLAPGDYNLSVRQANAGLKHVVVAGTGGTAYALPMPAEKDYSKGKSTLQLVELGGDYFVKEYRSQTTGKIYAFATPKTKNRVTRTLEIQN